MKSVTLSDGRRKYFQSKIRHWWIEDISNWNRKNLEWHFDGCNFTLRKLQLCTMMFVALHFKRCNFASQWLLLCIASFAELFGSQISNIFLPHIEWVTFCRREFYIPYENQLHSLREYTSFFTRIHFILVRNEVYSRIEHKILSAGNNYFLGLKILYSRQESIAISGRNKIKAISMGI